MIKRTIYTQIIKSIKSRPVTLITGARQVGKSTLCREIMKEFSYNYVSLDNRQERAMAQKDPEMFLSIHSFPLIIDEVQYAPALFEVIEERVNKEKFENGNNYGMYILTGSQSYRLMEGISQSMAGRVSIIRMSPLSMSEIHNQQELPFKIDPPNNAKRIQQYKISVNELFNTIVKGLYPELYDNPNLEIEQFYSDYVDTYIERDISQIINIQDKLKFENFMQILASCTGEELVYDSIAKAIGVTVKTVQAWVSVLVLGNIITLLQPYKEDSIVKRIVKRPKIYFNDTGLACYLARLNNPETLRVSRFSGRFVETYIITEIIKSYQNNGKKTNFYYYRDNNQNEIDLVILEQGTLHLVECKSGISFNESAIKGFKQLDKTNYQKGLNCIICNTENIYPINDSTYVLPISSI